MWPLKSRSGWVRWGGAGRPPYSDIVRSGFCEIEHASGEIWCVSSETAILSLRWSHEGKPDDIIAYCVARPKTSFERERALIHKVLSPLMFGAIAGVTSWLVVRLLERFA